MWDALLGHSSGKRLQRMKLASKSLSKMGIQMNMLLELKSSSSLIFLLFSTALCWSVFIGFSLLNDPRRRSFFSEMKNFFLSRKKDEVRRESKMATESRSSDVLSDDF